MSHGETTDKRLALLGVRKSGYSGHVPACSFFHRKLQTTSIHAPVDTLRASPPPTTVPDIEKKGAPSDVLERLARPRYTKKVEAPRRIPGYAGRQAGKSLSDCLPRETVTCRPQGGKSSPIPRYPLLRGPTRINPLGMDVYLSN